MSNTTTLKNRLAFGAKRIKMSDDTYALRRRVLDVIYQAKKSVVLPRIEVRIVDLAGSPTMGYAYMGKNIVHIDRSEAMRSDDRLRVLVLHEVLHAVLATPHHEECPLMSSTYVPMTSDDAWKTFRKYFQR